MTDLRGREAALYVSMLALILLFMAGRVFGAPAAAPGTPAPTMAPPAPPSGP